MNKKVEFLFPYFIITGLSLILIHFMFGDAFWHPNLYAFMNGGDGNVIYFNMLYHTVYGHGVYLGGMNYPDPECIFMTDAQGAISIVLNGLKNIFPSINTHVLGIVHVLIMVGIWLQYILLYKIIEKLNGSTWLAILFALGIGTLSPQLVRISYGHLGLAYPFIIPMTILWLLGYKDYSIYNWRSILFAITVLFFGLNNPYLLVIVSVLLISYGGVGAIISKSLRLYFRPIVFGFGFLLTLYFVAGALDPYNDRIQNQWGSFYFASTLEDLLWGKYSLLNTIIESLGFPFEGRSESRASVSLISLMILITGSFSYGIRHFRGTRIPWSHPLVILTLATGLSFIYASSIFKSKWWLWIVEDLGFVTMIKATGRLSWINYYVLSLLSVFIIIKVSQRFYTSRLVQLGVFVIGVFWCGEGYLYINDHVRPSLNSNHFSTKHLDEYITPIKKVVDFSKYQGVLSIPMMQTWNDNLMNSADWATELQVFSLSAATGIPLIGAKLSRSPVGRSLVNLQLTADPLIKKEIMEYLNPDKPLLLIKTCNIQVETNAEEWLLERAKIVYQDKDVDIFELWSSTLDNQDHVEEQLQKCSSQREWYYYQGFSNREKNGKIGNGGITSTTWKEVDNTIIPDSVSGAYELSIWSYVNIEKYGMPVFEIWVFNKEDQQVSYDYIDSRNFLDNQNGWLKMHHQLYLQPNQKIILKAKGRYPMKIDELLLRPINGYPTCIDITTSIKSINNILVLKS